MVVILQPCGVNPAVKPILQPSDGIFWKLRMNSMLNLLRCCILTSNLMHENAVVARAVSSSCHKTNDDENASRADK